MQLDLKCIPSESERAADSAAAQGTMKVFDLCCDQEHPFEGWFASGEDFDRQLAVGMIECPVCASTQVRKLLSAPRLNLGGRSAEVIGQRTGGHAKR